LGSKSNVRSGWIGVRAELVSVVVSVAGGVQGVFSWKIAFVNACPPAVTSKQMPKPLFVKPQ